VEAKSADAPVAVTIVIGVVFGAWLVLSALNQYEHGRLVSRVKRRDLFSLIPVWTFFAPRPGITDFNVLYRDRSPEGAYSPWRELEPLDAYALRGVWNPRKRMRKGITDVCNAMMRISGRRIGSRMYVQLPYLMLLNSVCAAPCSVPGSERQFAIVRTFGYTPLREPHILFVSALHRLEEPQVAAS
jgi:hypothetical protein